MSANGEDDGAVPRREMPATISGVVDWVAGIEARATNHDRAIVSMLGRQQQQTDLLMQIHAGMVRTEAKVDNLSARMDGHVEQSETRGVRHSDRLKTLETKAAEEMGAERVRADARRDYVVPVVRWVVLGVLAAAGLWALHLAGGKP